MSTKINFPSTIIFVRHGHVEGIDPKRFRGQTDLALTPLGLKQAQLTAQFIALHWKIDAIYSSPLQRCLITATGIGESCGVAVAKLEQLIDISYGRWQGQTVEDVKNNEPELYDLWLKHPQCTFVEGAETLADVQARIARAFSVMASSHPQETVLAVGHDSTIRIFLSYLLDLPLSHYWQFEQNPCAISELRLLDTGYQIRQLNNVSHLLQLTP